MTARLRIGRFVRGTCEKGMREEVAILAVCVCFLHLSVVVGRAELLLMLVRMVPKMQSSSGLMLAIRGSG